jgi:polyisoprenoid-binding protein YceI
MRSGRLEPNFVKFLPSVPGRWLMAALALLPATGLAAANGYPIDSARSQAVFGVRVLWLHTISGRFAHIVGVLRPDPSGTTAVVNASISVSSVEMESMRTRRWMLAPDFFDAEHYPDIHFISDPVPLAALEHGGDITGRLSMRGRIRPVRFALLPSRCSLNQPKLCMIEVQGSVQRGDFDMSSYRGALADQVDLSLEITLDEPLH